MKINKLKITSFGKLNDVSIALDDKITVINAKNEAGKSTIAAFVRYMLYGFCSGSKKSLAENDKKKYTSWDSDSVSGELVFTAADGKLYTAVRKNASRAQSVILDQNGSPVFDNGNAGSIFLGVDEQVYQKSAFVGQGDISFSDDGELEKALNNMASSGNQDMDASGAVEKLTKLKKELLGLRGNTGKIYKIDEELMELTSSKQKWQGGHTELLESENKLAITRDKISQNNAKLESLKAESFNADCLDAKQKLNEIEALRQTALNSKAALEQLLSSASVDGFTPDAQYIDLLSAAITNAEQSKTQCELAKSNVSTAKEKYSNAYSDKKQQSLSEQLDFIGMSPQNAINKAADLKKAQKNAFSTALVLTVLILTIPVAIFFWIKHSNAKKELNRFIASLGYGSYDELLAALNSNQSFRGAADAVKGMFQNASEDYESKAAKHEQNIKALYSITSRMVKNVDITTLMQVSKELLAKLKTWNAKAEQQKKLCSDDYIRFSTLSQSVDINALTELAQKYDQSIPIRKRDIINREIRFYTIQNDEFLKKERELEKRTAVLSETLPKPAEMQSRISSLEEQKKLLTLQYKQLDLAIQSLSTASSNMKNNMSPIVSGKASELFSVATAGKYRGLYTTDTMELSFLESGNAAVRDVHYLSTGTLELAFISLRIALCGYLYRENPTLIFDDAFTHLDDDRLKSVMELIQKLSQSYQIVIMSCHDRESKLLAGKAKIIDFAID